MRPKRTWTVLGMTFVGAIPSYAAAHMLAMDPMGDAAEDALQALHNQIVQVGGEQRNKQFGGPISQQGTGTVKGHTGWGFDPTGDPEFDKAFRKAVKNEWKTGEPTGLDPVSDPRDPTYGDYGATPTGETANATSEPY